MVGDTHGDETTEVTEAPKDGKQQETKEQPKMTEDWKAPITERDGRIVELEAQVAEAAKSVETAEALRSEIAQLKEQGEIGTFRDDSRGGRLHGGRLPLRARACVDLGRRYALVPEEIRTF